MVWQKRVDEETLEALRQEVQAFLAQRGMYAMRELADHIGRNRSSIHHFLKDKHRVAQPFVDAVRQGMQALRGTPVPEAPPRVGQGLKGTASAATQRLTPAELASLRAELHACLHTMPIGSNREKRLAELAGCSAGTIYLVNHGESCSRGMAVKIRAGIAKVKQAGHAPERPPRKNPGWSDYATERALAQEPQRARLKALLSGGTTTVTRFAQLSKVNPSNLYHFIAGRGTAQKTLERIEPQLDALENGAPRKATAMQRVLPFERPRNSERVAIMAARLQTLDAPQVDHPDVNALVESFAKKIGVEAIELALKLLKAKGD